MRALLLLCIPCLLALLFVRSFLLFYMLHSISSSICSALSLLYAPLYSCCLSGQEPQMQMDRSHTNEITSAPTQPRCTNASFSSIMPLLLHSLHLLISPLPLVLPLLSFCSLRPEQLLGLGCALFHSAWAFTGHQLEE